MDLKSKQTLFTVLYIALIVSVIAFMIWIYFWLQTESVSCLKQPLDYYSAKVGKQCFCVGDLVK